MRLAVSLEICDVNCDVNVVADLGDCQRSAGVACLSEECLRGRERSRVGVAPHRSDRGVGVDGYPLGLTTDRQTKESERTLDGPHVVHVRREPLCAELDGSVRHGR